MTNSKAVFDFGHLSPTANKFDERVAVDIALTNASCARDYSPRDYRNFRDAVKSYRGNVCDTFREYGIVEGSAAWKHGLRVFASNTKRRFPRSIRRFAALSLVALACCGADVQSPAVDSDASTPAADVDAGTTEAPSMAGSPAPVVDAGAAVVPVVPVVPSGSGGSDAPIAPVAPAAPAGGSGGSAGGSDAPVAPTAGATAPATQPEHFCQVLPGQRYSGQTLGCDDASLMLFNFLTLHWTVPSISYPHVTHSCDELATHPCVKGDPCTLADSRDGQPNQKGVCL